MLTGVHLCKIVMRHHRRVLKCGRQRLLLDVMRHMLHLRMTLRLLGLTDFELSMTLLSVPSSSVHASIPPVLHGVVAASSESSGDLSPSLSHLCNHLLDQDALLRCNGIVVEVGLEVLVISLSALFWGTGLDGCRYPYPVVSSMNIDQVKEQVVLLLGPGSTFVLRHYEDMSGRVS